MLTCLFKSPCSPSTAASSTSASAAAAATSLSCCRAVKVASMQTFSSITSPSLLAKVERAHAASNLARALANALLADDRVNVPEIADRISNVFCNSVLYLFSVIVKR